MKFPPFSTRYLIMALAFALVSVAVAMPLLPASTVGGLSSGVIYSLSTSIAFIIALMAGVWAVQLGGEGVFIFPFSFLALFIMGSITDVHAFSLPFIRLVVFACALLLMLVVSVAYSKKLLLSVCIAALPAYLLGVKTMAALPASVSAAGYLAGSGAILVLLLGIGVGIGVLTYNATHAWISAISIKKNFPQVA